MWTFVFYFLAIIFAVTTVSIGEANKTSLSFSVDLIHRDSPLSPLYNSSMTSSEAIKNAALRSISRSKRVHFMDQKESIETSIIPDDGAYLMKFYIGTPPVERLALADTGSDLIWVQCSPCEKCFDQDTPLFNPNTSSTFMNVSCDSHPCTLLPARQHRCGKSGQCEYAYEYAGQSYTIGELGIDAINFGSATFPKSIFGCGTYNRVIPTDRSRKLTGFVGLGAGNLSLVSQLGDNIGNKFSYCLLPFASNSTSKLKFGSEAKIEGKGVVSTPIIIKPSSPTFYYLNLEGISVGQKKVQNGQSDHGNIVIDSGTTFTMLKASLFNNFVTLLKEAFGVEAEKNSPLPFCFRYENGKNITFPEISFQFTEANVPLSPGNLFIEVDNNLLCLLMVPTGEQGIPIYGNVAQINFQVEYDLEGKKVSFAPTDCTKN